MTLVAMVTLALLKCSFSSIFYVLIAGTVGVALYAIETIKEKKK
jgi:hypothetical protein